MKAWITIQRYENYKGGYEPWKLPSYPALETNRELVDAKLKVSELSSPKAQFKVVEIEIPEDVLNPPEAQAAADLPEDPADPTT